MRSSGHGDPGYAELHCLSDFSFGRGASSARELFTRAKAQGYSALAITDECSLAGIVRALEASEATGVPLIVGSEFQLACGLRCVLLVENARGYPRLCALITRGRRAADKGTYRLTREDFEVLDGGEGLLCLWLPGEASDASEARFLQAQFPERAWLAVELHRGPDDDARLRELLALADTLGIPALASGDVHMHERQRRPVQDTLTALRHHRPLAEAGPWLFPNGERHLRTRRALTAIYPAALRAESVAVAARCRFDLRQLRYTYPRELVPEEHTPTSWLAELTWRGARERWPQGTPEGVQQQLREELTLIAELGYEAFFLTVHDVVVFARGRGILCQGRGSAANSAVCFALGITAVDPARANLLFGRFLSRERKEPPDIDVDFEHERREEVLQYVYAKYGRERAALAATVITWGPKSAVRAVGAAFGMDSGVLDLMARAVGHSEDWDQWQARCRERGLDPDEPRLSRLLAVAFALLGHPRHLSQHVGGFVIADTPLHTLVPVENAAMAERTIIQWDKDDLETLGLLKVDCLALGMLTAIRKCLDLLRRHGRGDYTLATLPAEDAATYAMIQRADTVGVFQIESRAQMAMLPRLKPRTFYDLVIEVAIVRPGPIEGGMVHPYLRRRQGLEPVVYASPALERVLGRTLGVPLFQEQVIEIAMVAAGYTPGEADELRRSMAAWKRHGTLETHRQRLLAGMAERGYPQDFAERIFEQVKGFGSYGFPESHAASFALLTYASCWLKCHEPAAFLCALLNAQPLGFYTASQLVQDARRSGVAVRPADVRCSDHDHTLEPWPGDTARQPALRLGLRQISGWTAAASARLTAARDQAAFRDVEDLCRRARLDAGERQALAAAGALKGLAGHRHRAHWESAALRSGTLPLFPDGEGIVEARAALPLPSEAADILADHAHLGLTLGRHPLALLRGPLRQRGYRSARELQRIASGQCIRAAGLVTLRQRPMTANGTTFLTLEDETGTVNVIVWQRVAERQRTVLMDSQLLGVAGRWERSAEGVSHLIAERFESLDALLGTLAGGGALRVESRSFR